LRGDLQCAFLCTVRATVEDEQDLVSFGRDPFLLRESGEARYDKLLLVAGRYYQRSSQRRVGWWY